MDTLTLKKLHIFSAIFTKAEYNGCICGQPESGVVMRRRRAKLDLDLFRQAGYMGGRCVVCRTRMRKIDHPTKPHMCDHCRETRTKPLIDTLPTAQREYSLKLEEQYSRGVQSLNASAYVPPPADWLAEFEKRQYRTHTQVKTVEHGPDLTTPQLRDKPAVSARVQELMDKLKNMV
jgi:hypothetical protein